jgi:hypothetical protein
LIIISGAAALSLLLAAAAMAARVVGDEGPNSLTGTTVMSRDIGRT